MKYVAIMVPTLCIALVVGVGLGLLMFVATLQGTINAFVLEAERRFK